MKDALEKAGDRGRVGRGHDGAAEHRHRARSRGRADAASCSRRSRITTTCRRCRRTSTSAGRSRASERLSLGRARCRVGADGMRGGGDGAAGASSGSIRAAGDRLGRGRAARRRVRAPRDTVPSRSPLAARARRRELARIHAALLELCATWRPDVLALEQNFVGAQRPERVPARRGARASRCWPRRRRASPSPSTRPATVKLAVVGHGPRREGRRCSGRSARELAPRRARSSADAADALAIALCHSPVRRRSSPTRAARGAAGARR